MTPIVLLKKEEELIRKLNERENFVRSQDNQENNQENNQSVVPEKSTTENQAKDN